MLPPKPSRRRLLSASALSALALGLPAKALADAPDSEDFTFIVVNDVHYVDEKCGQWFAKVLDGMKKHQADFCLLVGDLVENGTAKQIGSMKDLLGGLKIPVHVVVGNHDHTPANDRKAYEDAFPDTLNYHFEHRGWQFIGLDTTQGFAGANTVIAKPTMDYLGAVLKKLNPKRPTVLFTHFPLGWLLPSRPTNAQALLQHFVDHNLQAVFNGHFHASTTRLWGPCELTTNTCCSLRRKNHDLDPRKGYFLCRTRQGIVKREYIQVNAG
jgi:hypothetical protein